MYGHAASTILAGSRRSRGIGDALRSPAKETFVSCDTHEGNRESSQGFRLRSRCCSAILHRRLTHTRRERDAMRNIENTAVNDLIARASGRRRYSDSMAAVDDEDPEVDAAQRTLPVGMP